MDRLLERWKPDLLFLQEANGDEVAEEPSLRKRFDHRFVRRGAGTPAGMALFSSFPLAETGILAEPPEVWDSPRVLWARLGAPVAGMVVASVHLRNPLGSTLILPVERGSRDAQRRAVSSWAASILDAGDRLLLGGDFNTNDCRLDRLTNVAEATGDPKPTWRPYGLPFAPPLLRLDHLFVGGGLEPRSSDTECRPTGTDHCALIGRVALR